MDVVLTVSRVRYIGSLTFVLSALRSLVYVILIAT